MKPCKKCGGILKYKNGECKPCKNIKRRLDYIKNRERELSVNFAYRVNNAEKISEITKKYHQANQERIKTYKRAYHKANCEKIREKANMWRRDNLDRYAITQQNYSARKRKNGGVLSKGLTEFLYKKQKGKCVCCGELLGDNYQLDHIMPVALGGANEDWNMQLLLPICNQRKHAKHPVDYMQEQGFLL